MLYVTASVAVKVHLCKAVPTLGVAVEFVKVNSPATEAPPLKVTSPKVCPKLIIEAVGAVVIVGVILAATVTLTVPVIVL